MEGWNAEQGFYATKAENQYLAKSKYFKFHRFQLLGFSILYAASDEVFPTLVSYQQVIQSFMVLAREAKRQASGHLRAIADRHIRSMSISIDGRNECT